MIRGDAGPDPSASRAGGRPAVGNVLGFAMLLSEGEVLLRLPARGLGPGIRLRDYEATVVGVELPLSGQLSAQSFRQHRCRVNRLSLELDRRTIEASLSERLVQVELAGMVVQRVQLDLTSRMDPSGDATPCLVLHGRVDGCETWVAQPVSFSPMGRRVAVTLGAPWVLGRMPVDAAQLAEALTLRLSPRSRIANEATASFDPLHALLPRPFVVAGWKAPDCSAVVVRELNVHAQSIEVVFGHDPPSRDQGGFSRRPGRVDAAIHSVRAAQRSGDPIAVIVQLDALCDALVHHDRARVAALRWLAEVTRVRDPARCLTALRVWLHLTPHDRSAMRMLLALVGRCGGERELAQRLAAACRFPNPSRMQARLELALANILVDRLDDRFGAAAIVDPLVGRLNAGDIDLELAAEIWTCVAKAHADDATAVRESVARALAHTERAAERASVQLAVGRAVAAAGNVELARRLLSDAATLAPDDADIAAAARAVSTAPTEVEPEVEPEPEPEPEVEPEPEPEPEPALLAVVPPLTKVTAAPSPSDAARQQAWETFERDGDATAALAGLEAVLVDAPTDVLVLSTLKSIAHGAAPERYLDALQRAVLASASPTQRDRFALELAMEATGLEDHARAREALARLSAAGAATLEAAAVRDWLGLATEDDDDDDDDDGPSQASPASTSDDAVLDAIEALLFVDDADASELTRLAQSLSPDEPVIRALLELAEALTEGAPQRRPLAHALLGHAAAIGEPWVALGALRQAVLGADPEAVLASWPELEQIVVGRGDDAALADLVAIGREAPRTIAARSDELLDTCLVAFPESAQLHTLLRHRCAEILTAGATAGSGPPDEPALDAAALEHVEGVVGRRSLGAIERARLLVGATDCMSGPSAAGILADRARSMDWRGPAFIVVVDALERAGHWPEVMALHEDRTASAHSAPERIDAHKRLAHICAEVLGDAHSAVVHLEQALKLSPTDPDLLLPLLDHHFGQRDLSRAVELTARVLDHVRMGAAAFASVANRAADAAIAMGDPVTAAELLSRVVSRAPDDQRAVARLRELELMAGDPIRRIELLGAVADRQAGKARLEALEERARLLLACERHEAAMSDLATVCREAPDREHAVRRLAALYREHERHEALVTLFEAQLQRCHGVDKIPPLLEIAELHTRHTGDLGRAEASLRIGLEHASSDDNDRLRIALEDALVANLERQGRYADLAAWFEMRLSIDVAPDPAGVPSARRFAALAHLAALYRDHLADEDAAATIYRRLETHGMLPDDGLATLARWYRKERRHEDLVRILTLRSTSLEEAGNDERRALVERWIAELLEGPLGRPQDAAAHYLEAYLADREGEDSVALRTRVLLSGTDSIVNVRGTLLARLKTLSPLRHPALLVLLADLLSPHDGYEAEAEACYRRALTGDSGLATAHEGLGRLLLRLGRPEDASRALIAAVRSDGLSPSRAADVAALAARALSEQGRAEQAESILRLALARVPDSQRALLELVQVHERAGRTDAQAEVLEQLAALPLSGPRHAEVAFQRAMLLRPVFGSTPRGPQGERARSLLLEAVSADTRHAAARQTLVELATAREEWSIVAHMHYLTVRELPPGSQRAAAHLDLAQVYLDRLGDPESCMRNIESALQQASDDIVVATRTTALARRMPSPSQAAEHFEEVAGGDNELDEAARARLWLLAADLRMDDAEPSAAEDEAMRTMAARLQYAKPSEAVDMLARLPDARSEAVLSQARERARSLASDADVHRDVDATGRLRELLAARGDYDEAVDLSRVLAVSAQHADPEHAARLLTEAAGFAWHALHEPVRAAGLLAEALVLWPMQAVASTAIDELTRAHEAGEYAAPLLQLLTRIEAAKRPPAVSLAIATLLRATGDEPAALTALRPLLDGVTDSLPATQLAALHLADRAYAARGDRPNRMLTLAHALQLGLVHAPERTGDTAVELARLHVELGDTASAASTCSSGLVQSPNHRGLLQLQAELLETAGEWTSLVDTLQRLAKVALVDEEQAMWLTRAARVMLNHRDASPDPSAPRRLLARACAVAPTRAEPRATLLPLSFSESRWRETLDLAEEMRLLPEARGEPDDFMILAALAEAYHQGNSLLASRLGYATEDSIEQWLLPGLRHILEEVATRGPLPRLDDVLGAAVRIAGTRRRLSDAMTRWALQRRLTSGIALGMGRLYEAHGDATRARHHYQLSAFLAPEGPVAGLVARLPGATLAKVDEVDLTGGSTVRRLLVAMRGALVGLPWAEAFTPMPPRLEQRALLEQVDAVLEPARRALRLPLPVHWVEAGPPLGVSAQACAPVAGILVSPAISRLPSAERAFRLAAAATDVAMGLAALAPPGPGLTELLGGLQQYLVPGFHAQTDDARTIAEALRLAGASRDPLDSGGRAGVVDELAHHRAAPQALLAELSRRRDVIATLLSGRLDGALLACARQTGAAAHPADRAAVVAGERAQWLLRALALR